MFKKLRNNFMLVNSIAILVLLICCFSTIYGIVSHNVLMGVNLRLDRELLWNTDSSLPQNRNAEYKPPAPENHERTERREMAHNGKNPVFSPTFSIICDKDGDVVSINMRFPMTEDFYSQRLKKIVTSRKEKGVITFTNSSRNTEKWQYKIQKVKKDNDWYEVAFTEVSSEKRVLRVLALCLVLIALLATIIVVFISFHFANRSIKPIEESYNKQKQFVADASHELKTPLTTINTNIEVLLSHDSSTIQDEKKWLLYIKDETERMKKLTNDLLYLARADHEDGTVIYSKVSFSQVLKNVMLVMEARVFESGIELSSDIEDDVFVNASSEQLKQLIMILMDNALKYTPKSGMIEVSLEKKHSDAVLAVKNTGEGISQEDIIHIFDRFYRSDKVRTHTEKSGFGLGLSIASAIVKTFKGSISAQSKPNESTVFTVKLPLVK